MIKTENKM